VDGRDAGLVSLNDIDLRHGRASFAIYIAEPMLRGARVGSFALLLLVRRAFEELALRKLCCEALASNEVALNLYRSFGFEQEGHFREHVLKSGRPVDVVALAMLRAEWEARRPSIEERLRDSAQRAERGEGAAHGE
jgi:RimJ/RimL family protein N-acetyltransferase